jgi:hypothetical protein
VIVRSMVRSAQDTERPNRGIADFQGLNTRTKDRHYPTVKPEIKSDNRNDYQATGRSGHFRARAEIAQVDIEDLVDMIIYDTFKTKKGNAKIIRGHVRERINNDAYREEFDNGKQKE